MAVMTDGASANRLELVDAAVRHQSEKEL